ncbi:MAG: WXG100 family type VII secretion target [Gordonia amarae]
MSNDALSVDAAAVRGHAGNLQEALSQFSTNSGEFDSAMTELLGNGMKGGGEQGFRALHTQWMESSETVRKGLEQLGVRTEDVASAYEKGSQEQDDSVRAAGNQMDFHVDTI